MFGFRNNEKADGRSNRNGSSHNAVSHSNGGNQSGARPPLPMPYRYNALGRGPHYNLNNQNPLGPPFLSELHFGATQLKLVLHSIECSKLWTRIAPSPFFIALRERKNQEAGWLRKLFRQDMLYPIMRDGVQLTFPEKERMVDQFSTLERSMLNYPVGKKEFKGLFTHAWNTSLNHFQYRIRKAVASKRKRNSTADFQDPSWSLPPYFRPQNPANAVQTTPAPRRSSQPLHSMPNVPPTPLQTTPAPRQSLLLQPSTGPFVRKLVSGFTHKMAVLNPDGSQSTQKRASESFKNGLKGFQEVCGGKDFNAKDLLSALSPPGYSQYRDSCITTWKKKAEVWKRAQRILNAGRYTGSAEEQNKIAAGLAMVPGTSHTNGEYLVATVRWSLFCQLGLKPTPEQFANSSPSGNLFKSAIERLAASCLVGVSERASAAQYLFLACDKGHRDGVDHFVKIICFWDDKKQAADYFTLDMDGAGSSDQEAADAIKHSLMLREFLDLIFSGQMTDNGGGATLESFYQVLREMGLTNEDFYFVANCTLHDLQLVMASPMEKVFGLGGTEKYNAMQLLHSMHDLEVFYFRESWKDLFAYTMQMVGMEGVVPRHMPEPITTRWWWLGIACDIAIKYWTIFKDIAIGSVNTFGSTSYANLVGSSLDTLMCEETFYGDIIFTKCFHDFVMTPHFDFLQSRGDRSKVAGFNSNNILVRYFLLALDLHSLQDGKWKEHPAFKEYIDHLNFPRWPTKEEEEKKLEKERRTEANSPSRLLKLDNDAGKIKSKLSKLLQSREKMQSAIEAHVSSYPESYWEVDLWKGPLLKYFSTLFKVPNSIFDEGATEKRAIKVGERANFLKELDISGEQIHIEREKLKEEVQTLNKQLEAIELGFKERLFAIFDAAQTDEENVVYWDPSGDYSDALQKLGQTAGEEPEGNVLLKLAVDARVKSLKEQIDDDIQKSTNNGVDEDDASTGLQEQDHDDDSSVDTSDGDPAATKSYEEIAERKANLFLQLSLFEMYKHFDRWANHLVFCGVASEKETARCVAEFLVEAIPSIAEPTTTVSEPTFWEEPGVGEVYTSKVHGREINLAQFRRFLSQRCTSDSLREVGDSWYYKQFDTGVEYLATGEDLWESQLAQVKALREWCQKAVLALPSNGQFVELAVKEGMHVGACNRSEAVRSVLAIARSFLIRRTNEEAKQEANTRDLRANQHAAGGKKGSRAMKKKTQEDDKKARFVARGSHKTKHLLRVIEQVSTITDEDGKQKVERLRKRLASNAASWKAKRIRKQSDTYKTKHTKHKKRNKRQMRQKVVYTYMTRGCIPYSSLKTEHIPQVQVELQTRGTAFASTDKISKLVSSLKVAVQAQDGVDENGEIYEKAFHPKSNYLRDTFTGSMKAGEI